MSELERRQGLFILKALSEQGEQRERHQHDATCGRTISGGCGASIGIGAFSRRGSGGSGGSVRGRRIVARRRSVRASRLWCLVLLVVVRFFLLDGMAVLLHTCEGAAPEFLNEQL